MKQAGEIIPWAVTDISLRPYDGMWSMNPSIHFDGTLWRCVLRCCDYAMPGGVTIRSKTARPTGQQTKNAMVIFDPSSWKAVQIFKMAERDNQPREACAHVGYEDMRIFATDKGGLQGIAASLHLRREHRRGHDGTQPRQPPEQVLLSFDARYDIVEARPIRGGGWSGTPQKNWVPFDRAVEPRFLFSIDKGTLFDERGALEGHAARVQPSTLAQDPSPLSAAASVEQTPERNAQVPSREEHVRKPRGGAPVRGGDARILRGGRVMLDTSASRPSAVRAPQRADSTARQVSTGRALPPRYSGLRGGTQLVRVGDDAWLGVGHEMKFVGGKKYYWHVWYVVDSCGKMKATSPPMKLAPNGIEFAAGLAIDGDRVVVSFGVDDMECRLGETKLSAVLATLEPSGH